MRFAEEITLLLLNDDGTFVHVPSWSLNYALAGGVLMDLALENRIDTDLEKLVLIDSTPTGDSLLDPTLADISAGDAHNARYWVERAAGRGPFIREEALSRLVAQGILERRDARFLWVFKSRRYPTIEGKAEQEVKLRIMGILFSDEIPDPRDVVIISLVNACRIFEHLLSRNELNNLADRIEQLQRLDLIGQAMTQAIRDIEASVAMSIHPYAY